MTNVKIVAKIITKRSKSMKNLSWNVKKKEIRLATGEAADVRENGTRVPARDQMIDAIRRSAAAHGYFCFEKFKILKGKNDFQVENTHLMTFWRNIFKKLTSKQFQKKYLRCSFPSWFQEALDLIWFARLTDESTITPPVCLLLARFCFFERVVVVDACGVDRFVLTKSF